MGSPLYEIYSVVEVYQKTCSFAALTRSFSDTSPLLMNKNRARALSVYFLQLEFSLLGKLDFDYCPVANRSDNSKMV